MKSITERLRRGFRSQGAMIFCELDRINGRGTGCPAAYAGGG